VRDLVVTTRERPTDRSCQRGGLRGRSISGRYTKFAVWVGVRTHG
jgi:hypothetical protein